jgi:hypothetical protein
MRRTFRRHIRKTLAQDVPPILQEANFAFDKGEYGRAAELFERIAEKAAARNGPRAPVFLLKAGQARMLAGQPSLGMPSLRRGLELLAQREEVQRLQTFGTRVVSELKDGGLQREADEMEAWLKSALPSASSAKTPEPGPVLPTHCPSCGAAVRPDEVEWLDDVTAECAYCGSPIN